MKKKQKERSQRGASHEVSLENRSKMDISLHYRRRGEGFPLVLLHGNGEDGT